MRSPLPLLLAAAAAGAATVEVRFTADFTTAVTSTSSTSCRGGAYRAHALTAAAGLRIDGGGVAAACGASTTCAQVFAAISPVATPSPSPMASPARPARQPTPM